MNAAAETCDQCGRTYPDATVYDVHECPTVQLIRRAMYAVCHEEVTRRGVLEPCELPSVAVRIDVQDGGPYPVCRRHVRAPMVPLLSVAAAQR